MFNIGMFIQPLALAVANENATFRAGWRGAKRG